jgi:hypothetical protein
MAWQGRAEGLDGDGADPGRGAWTRIVMAPTLFDLMFIIGKRNDC